MANLPDKPQIGDTGHVPDTSMIIDAIADLDARKVETLAIGTVTTDAPGSQATASIHPGPSGTHTMDLSIPAGAPGAKGDPGDRGPQGPEGKGVPTGGLAGQVLTKRSGFDHDTEWVTTDTTGTISHGGLADLDGDHHPQYVKKAGDTMTGNLIVQKATAQITSDSTSGQASVVNRSANGSAYYYADSAAGQYAGLLIRDAATNKNRWLFAKASTAEPGSNAGSDLVLARYDDAGNYIGPSALTVSRATGLVTLAGDPVAGKGAATKDYADTKVGKTGDQTIAGILTVSRDGTSSILSIARPAGFHGILQFATDALRRWQIRCNDVEESGGNVGSNLIVYRYDDAGITPTLAMQINRASGDVTFYGPVTVSEPVATTHAATKQYVDNKGVWQAWTPTIAGITTSSVVARYTQIGRTVFYRARLQVSALTGDVTLTVPVAEGTLPDTAQGEAIFVQAATGKRWAAEAFVTSAKIYVRRVDPASGEILPLTATTPITWVANDVIIVAGCYEANVTAGLSADEPQMLPAPEVVEVLPADPAPEVLLS